ncbi:MAG: glutathione S-transferase family protein [Maricaulaceae bacterium]|jgi:glutathione S-transferase
MKLYTGPLSMFGGKAEIAVHEKALACEIEHVPHNLRTRYDPKHPEVVRINPKGQIPVLIDGDLELFDSTLILEYLEDAYPDHPLWPSNPAARAVARQWELKSDEVFFPEVVKLMSLGRDRESPEAKAALDGAERFYDTIEERLSASAHIGDESFGCADIAFIMAHYFAVLLGAEIKERHARLDAWRRRVVERPAVARVLGPVGAYLTENTLPVPAFARAA